MLLQPRLALVSIVVVAATDAAWLRSESPDDTTLKRRAVLELDFGALFGGADSQAAIEEREQEQAELRLLDELRETVPYRQDAVISLPADAGSIRGFCVLPNDGLAVIAGASEGFGAALLASLFGDRSPPPPSRVHWLDPDGVVLRSATLDFAPKAVTAAARAASPRDSPRSHRRHHPRHRRCGEEPGDVCPGGRQRRPGRSSLFRGRE